MSLMHGGKRSQRGNDGKRNRLQTTRDDIWFTILMITITPAQIQSHMGISSTGNKLMAQQATNTMSDTLSKMAPVLLSAWSFLASQPSIISLSPPSTYSDQNGQPLTSQNSRLMEPAILSTDMTFGKCVL